jgi:hypothetical protein
VLFKFEDLSKRLWPLVAVPVFVVVFSHNFFPITCQNMTELLNDRNETSSQQARRVFRELQSDVNEEVNGEGAHPAPREDPTIAQLRRAEFGNPEPRNGTG